MLCFAAIRRVCSGKHFGTCYLDQASPRCGVVLVGEQRGTQNTELTQPGRPIRPLSAHRADRSRAGWRRCSAPSRAACRGSSARSSIKRIRPDKSDSPKFVQMFCEEARISALLHHPNIVQVYDFGHIDGAYFMAMEHLDGSDLSSVMRALRAHGRAMPPSVAAFIARDVARALHHAHTLRAARGTSRAGSSIATSRPSNIMLLKAGGVKILDFGIAKAAALARRARRRREAAAPGRQARLHVARAGARARRVDQRSDVFSLGVVLWEMVAGQRLFAAESESGHPAQRPACSRSPRRRGVATAPGHAGRDRRARARARSGAALRDRRGVGRRAGSVPGRDPGRRQEIPKLLEELASAPPPAKRDDVSESPSVTSFSGGTAAAASAVAPAPTNHPSPAYPLTTHGIGFSRLRAIAPSRRCNRRGFRC